MGSKVNPNGLRYGINKNWLSRWIAKDSEQESAWLIQDDQIRNYIYAQYKNAHVGNIEIERRNNNNIFVVIYVSQPGVILSDKPAPKARKVSDENKDAPKTISGIQALTLAINKIVGRKVKVIINVQALNAPDLNARIIAREIADAIENRVSFRNAQKAVMRKVLKAGAKGVKTHVSGRLGGVEMAREEGYSQGIITLSTLRADVDYALEKAETTYGIIGVKVWINRGEIFGKTLTSGSNQGRAPRNNKRDGAKRPNNGKPGFNKKPSAKAADGKRVPNNNSKKPASPRTNTRTVKANVAKKPATTSK